MGNLLNKKRLNKSIIWISLIFFVSINIVYFVLHLNLKLEVSEYAFKKLFIRITKHCFIRKKLLGEIAWHLNNFFLIKPKVFLVIFLF